MSTLRSTLPLAADDDEPDRLFDEAGAEQSSGGYVMFDLPLLHQGPDRPNRHTVSASAVLSAEEVIYLIGGRAAVARQWLRRVRPLAHPSGRRVYLWSDVLSVLREGV